MKFPRLATVSALVFEVGLIWSVLLTKTVDGSMCYQGTIMTDNNLQISLSEESLSNFDLQVCTPPTTTMKPTTTIELTSTEFTTAPNTDLTTTMASMTANVKTQTTTAAVPLNPTTAAPLTTTAATTLKTTTAAPLTTTAATTLKTTTVAPSGRRKRDESTETYNCNIFMTSTDTSGELTFSSRVNMQFSCSEKDFCDGAKSKDNVTMPDGQTGTMYCCNDTDGCNYPQTVPSVTIKTIESCNHYTNQGLKPFPCLSNAHLCINQTNDEGDTSYFCGDKTLEATYCVKDNWYYKGCNDNVCCYLEESQPSPPNTTTAPPNTTTASPTVPMTIQRGSLTGAILISVSVALVTGMFIGCVLLVVIQKKCKKKSGFADDMMDFSYSKFQSAESGDNDDNDL